MPAAPNSAQVNRGKTRVRFPLPQQGINSSPADFLGTTATPVSILVPPSETFWTRASHAVCNSVQAGEQICSVASSRSHATGIWRLSTHGVGVKVDPNQIPCFVKRDLFFLGLRRPLKVDSVPHVRPYRQVYQAKLSSSDCSYSTSSE